MKILLRTIFLLSIISLLASCNASKVELKVPSIISDNMVLQQSTTVKIWGWSNPGESIEVTPSWGDAVYVGANDRGQWMADVETPSAGGPFILEIKGNNKTITINNVMVGEVWLCSGQSNMEMPLNGFPPADIIDNAKAEIANADYPSIRMFTAAQVISPIEKEDVPGSWAVCSPKTAGTFSATAYFFGRELYKQLNVPIGLIHSSWGGTPVESWTSTKKIGDVPGYEDFTKSISSIQSDLEKHREWLSNKKTFEIKDVTAEDAYSSIDVGDLSLAAFDADDSQWSKMNLPVMWELTDLKAFDGIIWFRKIVELDKDWTGKDLVLSLGPIDDMDATYFNGVKIGGMESDGYYAAKRIYDVPKDLIKEGKNVIAVRVVDTKGGGGLWGKKEQLTLSIKDESNKSISIAGEWNFLPIVELFENVYYIIGTDAAAFASKPVIKTSLDQNTPTVLYNGMIKPLIPYTIKGAIWYQGEANVGRSKQYETLFPTMITSWREDWGIGDFPFYFVQIAPYKYSNNPDDPASAYIRGAQFTSYKTPNTGIVSTLDIGSAKTIHPGNKQEVGRRLALWAFNKDYDLDMICSGPLYTGMEVKGNKVTLSFDSIGSGLVLKNNGAGFIICGEDQKFVDATAKIEGGKLIVWSPKVKTPVAVRYSWKDVPEISLFNIEDLPAPTFRTDDWDE